MMSGVVRCRGVSSVRVSPVIPTLGATRSSHVPNVSYWPRGKTSDVEDRREDSLQVLRKNDGARTHLFVHEVQY